MTWYHLGVVWVLYRVKHYVLCMGLENESNNHIHFVSRLAATNSVGVCGPDNPPLVTCKPQDIFAETLPAQLTYPSWTTSNRGPFPSKKKSESEWALRRTNSERPSQCDHLKAATPEPPYLLSERTQNMEKTLHQPPSRLATPSWALPPSWWLSSRGRCSKLKTGRSGRSLNRWS